MRHKSLEQILSESVFLRLAINLGIVVCLLVGMVFSAQYGFLNEYAITCGAVVFAILFLMHFVPQVKHGGLRLPWHSRSWSLTRHGATSYPGIGLSEGLVILTIVAVIALISIFG